VARTISKRRAVKRSILPELVRTLTKESKLMTQNAQVQHVNHGDKTAYHMDFGLRPEGAIWKGRRAIRPNFYPLATDLRNWMLQNGRLTFSTKNSDSPHPYTNPYTHDGSI
jgi:hypothetical protein